MPNHKWAKQGQEVSRQGAIMVTKSAIGYFGYFAGHKVHIMDDLGLADPLLARLPVPDPKKWRIGHFRRRFPNGYLQSLRFNTNAIKDSNLHKYYDKLKILTRGELFSLKRINEIIKFTMGRYDHFLEAYDDTPVEIIDIDEYNKIHASDSTSSTGRYFTIPDAGIQLAFGEIKLSSQLEVELDSDDDYILVFLNTHVEVFDKIIPAADDTTGIIRHLVDIPAPILIEGYDGLRIYPYNGDDIFRLGRIRLID